MSDVSEIILLDKPKGITSFDCIRQLRRELGVKKMGHAGTLDPLATGLMIIGVGSGTKRLHEYLKLPKTYEAEILLGKKTTTGDLEGEVVEVSRVGPLTEEEVMKMLGSLIGTIVLPVPVYSAIKVNGRPLYRYAREGKEVVIPKKEMTVTAIELLSLECKEAECVLSVTMDVRSGTYIRSLAEEIGRRLGYPATLQNLRRTQIGPFSVENARKLR